MPTSRNGYRDGEALGSAIPWLVDKLTGAVRWVKEKWAQRGGV